MPKFRETGVKLYAISYDDRHALAAFADNYGIDYPLLSDVGSAVIRRYGILNTEIRPGDLPAYGVPFPGTYVTDEKGVVIEKFFHDSYKKRDSAETLIDAALGKVLAERRRRPRRPVTRTCRPRCSCRAAVGRCVRESCAS
jgi:peroxiredoxin